MISDSTRANIVVNANTAIGVSGSDNKKSIVKIIMALTTIMMINSMMVI